ncbi:MAG: threonylcarbamoyl-AMP synthase [Cytophagales bacterium]|nr:threonylcarbamoyl-AMP synthase [Cytophagales bacterium]
MHEEIQKALEVLNNGGIIVYPTDTIWGIGCDATNPEAVKKVYELKERDDSKALVVLIHELGQLYNYVQKVPEIAWDIVEFAETPLTVVYPQAKNIAHNLVAEDNSVAIRWCKDEFCQKLMQRFKRPLVATSANISGEPSPKGFADISETVLERADYVVNWRKEELNNPNPSKIISLGVDGEFKLIRK